MIALHSAAYVPRLWLRAYICFRLFQPGLLCCLGFCTCLGFCGFSS